MPILFHQSRTPHMKPVPELLEHHVPFSFCEVIAMQLSDQNEKVIFKRSLIITHQLKKARYSVV